jgi:hypothetical protein
MRILSKAELYAKYKMLLFKPYADRSYCPSKHFWAESGRSAALAGRQQYQITGEKEKQGVHTQSGHILAQKQTTSNLCRKGC